MKDIVEELMDELINEIDNMSSEEYLTYHKEALKMKKSYEEMIESFLTINELNNSYYQIEVLLNDIPNRISENFNNITTECNVYKSIRKNRISRKENDEWQIAA